jgi:hypothetical protein
MRVVCICRAGQVRSVAARHLLIARGFRKVVACGWEVNDRDTVKMLCLWADAVLVVGRGALWNLPVPPEKEVQVEVGQDVWGRYDHPDLLALLEPQIEALVAGEVSPCLTLSSTP